MKPMKSLILFLALALSVNARGLHFCASEIVEFAARHLLTYTGSLSFILPPQSKRYLIGSLAVFENGPRVLGIGGFHTRHYHIDRALEELHAEHPEYGPFRYEWLGEIAMENTLKRQAIGRVIAANEISGFFYQPGKPIVATNDVTQLDKALVRFGGVAKADALFLPYTGDHYLFPQLIELKAEFERLQKAGEIHARVTFRHYITSIGGTFLQKLKYHFDDHKNYPTPQSKIAGLDNFWKKPLGYQAFQLYLDFLENDGIFVDEIRQLRSLLSRAHYHQRIPTPEIVSFSEMLSVKAKSLVRVGLLEYCIKSVDLLKVP